MSTIINSRGVKIDGSIKSIIQMIKNTKFLTLIFTLFYVLFGFSQNGQITYSVSINTENIPIKDEIKNTYNQLVETAKKQEFVLRFNKSLSNFNIKNQLYSKDAYDAKIFKISKSAFTARNEVFTNLPQKEVIEKTDDNILIKKKHQTLSWNITTETKKIDKYTCYKATLVEYFPKKDDTTGSRVITAWFAPVLPYSFGPKTYYGLPGLILELTEKSTTFYASKIELSDKEVIINFPSGKTITQKAYDNKLKAQMGM